MNEPIFITIGKLRGSIKYGVKERQLEILEQLSNNLEQISIKLCNKDAELFGL